MPSLTLTGAEDVVFEDTELDEFSGHIFLDKMIAGDIITIRIYVKDVNETSGDQYKKWVEDTYQGVQSCPALRVEPSIAKVGYKVTAQQSQGSYKTITSQWYKR